MFTTEGRKNNGRETLQTRYAETPEVSLLHAVHFQPKSRDLDQSGVEWPPRSSLIHECHRD